MVRFSGSAMWTPRAGMRLLQITSGSSASVPPGPPEEKRSSARSASRFVTDTGPPVPGAAERCRELDDELVERALNDGVALHFLSAIHATLPTASATVDLLEALRDVETDPGRRDRLARAANAAEERLIRLYQSVFRAAALREEPLITWDREEIRETLATKGQGAAEDLVNQLIEYQDPDPRAMRADLLQGRRV